MGYCQSGEAWLAREGGGLLTQLTFTGRPGKRHIGWWQKQNSGQEECSWRNTTDYSQPRRNSGKPQEGEAGLHQRCLRWKRELSTSTRYLVGHWKEYFKDHLNPTATPSVEDAVAKHPEIDSSITQTEAQEAVQKLLSVEATRVDGIWADC